MASRHSTADTSTGIVVVMFYLAILIGGGIGWVWNIVKIVGTISEPLTAMFIARAVGVFFFPLGVILGYL